MDKKKILIVEDEGIVALDLKKILEKQGFEVTCMAYDYNSALNSVRMDRPDIILMDINLGPNSKDGIAVANKIKILDDIPIIYCTAFSDETTIDRAIKTAPVSYLVKPYNEEEIKSNILLGLYKKSTGKDGFKRKDKLHIGFGYYYDFFTSRLYYKERFIKLSTREDTLLRILIKARGNYVEFDELCTQIWTEGTVSDSALRTLIYRLRSKLEYKIIETLPNLGCKLNYKFKNNKK